jgi:hypothetical protein
VLLGVSFGAVMEGINSYHQATPCLIGEKHPEPKFPGGFLSA